MTESPKVLQHTDLSSDRLQKGCGKVFNDMLTMRNNSVKLI